MKTSQSDFSQKSNTSKHEPHKSSIGIMASIILEVEFLKQIEGKEWTKKFIGGLLK